MNAEEVNRIVEELKQKVVGYDSKDIELFFRELTISIDERSWITILGKLAEDANIFRWFQFICKKLPDIAKADPQFIDLISKIIQRVKADMSAGILCAFFIKIGRENPDLGFKLFEMLSRNEDANLRLWSGSFLGGAAIKDPNTLFKKMMLEYRKSDPYVRAAFIKAIRIIRENNKAVEIPSEILDIIITAVNDQHSIVRAEAIASCITFFDYNQSKFGSLLLDLAEKGSAEDKIHILTNLCVHKLADEKLEFEIIQKCSEETDARVLSAVGQVLCMFGRAKENPEKTLEIVKTWITKRVFRDVPEALWIFDNLQGSDLEKCFSTIESWIRKDANALLLFEIPRLLSKIFLKDPVKLINFLGKWKDKGEPFVKILLATLREILSMVYSKEIESKVVDLSWPLLSSLAEKKGLNVNQIIRGEEDKLFQSFKLTEEMELERPELSYDEIYQNLQEFKAIRDFFGLEWFKEKEREKNKTHPLLIFLSRAKIDLSEIKQLIDRFINEKDELTKAFIYDSILTNLYAPAFLKHLDDMLGLFTPNEQGTKHIRTGLSNEEQFWQTISELEIAASFKKKHPIAIEPVVGRKRLDVQVKINSVDLLFEVISPEMFKPLHYVSGVVKLKNRVKEKIAEKIERQLKYLIDLINCPLILVMDLSRSEIDYEDITATFEGSLAIRLILNTQSRKVIDERIVRSQDSLSRERPESKIVSAVIAYKRDIAKDGKITLKGKVFKNPVALYPLDNNTYEVIIREIFTNGQY
jgi:hypothetical protein